ncbi:ABC transporter substrate-binding protein [Herbiconiux sp. CPCC 205763]|uniref:ABC transporter substrate-binding protein n=1 Tax=Herbiconiux aconitum TaxID=2970913 RepID=A0ABT2GN80_9MICO|nr:ABC transporter substrate-binding protein [Herbiconiux aconitum]MCS5717685.1 ABC transporter substrate-binding protein [Herbiconiux aconitum]
MKVRSSRRKSGVVAAIATMAVSAAILSGCAASTPAADSGGKLVVWVDSARQAQAEAYAEAQGASNFDIVVVDAAQLQSKLSQVKDDASSRPDVVFTPNSDAPAIAGKFDLVQDLSGLVDDKVKDGFGSTLSACTSNGVIDCLPQDVATVVLWYNKPLMDQFGYTVPTTWTEYAQLGEKVATEHPGYVMGSCADWACPNVFYRSNQCTGVSSNDGVDAVVNLASDPNCTEVTDMLDPLIKNKSIATLGPFDTDFATVMTDDKLLMMPGFIWFPGALFKDKVPNGSMAAAPLPLWDNGVKGTAASVGGQWFVVKQSSRQQAGLDFIEHQTTDLDLLASLDGGPAYGPARDAWAQAQGKSPVYAEDPSPTLVSAFDDIKDVDFYVEPGFDLLTSFSNTVGPAIKGGDTIAANMDAWQKAFAQTGTDYGLNVKIE